MGFADILKNLISLTIFIGVNTIIIFSIGLQRAFFFFFSLKHHQHSFHVSSLRLSDTESHCNTNGLQVTEECTRMWSILPQWIIVQSQEKESFIIKQNISYYGTASSSWIRKSDVSLFICMNILYFLFYGQEVKEWIF